LFSVNIKKMKDKKRSRDTVVSIIDSDVLMRQILSSMLRKEEGIKLSGSFGFCGIDKTISQINIQQPDVIMLGIEDSASDEMKLFYQLRKEFPKIFIVLLTPLNKEGASIALQGLKDGAIEYITKPDKRNGLILAGRHFHKRVLPLIKSIPRLNRERIIKPVSLSKDRTVVQAFSLGSRRMIPENVELIIIGSCLGGVTSLYKLISKLPVNLPVPVVIVQHMPKIYTEELSADLDKVTSLNVREAKDNSVLLPGQIYVAPGGYHSVIKNEGNRKRIFLHRGPREHKFRPSIDVLLRSAIQAYGGRLLSVFLSGGGNDGIQGASMVLEHGGSVILESKESSLLWDIAAKICDLRKEIIKASAESLASEIIKLLNSELKQSNYMIVRDEAGSLDTYAG
jgi:two-component system, chemotaxis family, protein-glutamate methylesterase/glutaminase